MEVRAKWLWALTTGNIVVTGLLIAVCHSIWLALSVMAPVISGNPLFVLVPLGVLLSICGLGLAKAVVPRGMRWATVVVNGGSLTLNLLVIFGLAMIFFGTMRERFLIPYGYKGDVYVVYCTGETEYRNERTRGLTYRIPQGGVVRSQRPTVPQLTSAEYYYEKPDGSLERIQNFWPTTIHRTPENLANEKDVGVFFPRSGKLSDSSGFSVEFEQFYVGTKARLLSQYRGINLGKYLLEHPEVCSK